MTVSISNQAYIFLWSCIGGMLMAFIFDVFRIKRKAIKTNKIVTYIEDLIYWIIVALVLFAVVYYSNEGEIRGYIIFGILIGIVIYTLVLSKYVMRLFILLIKITVKIVKTIYTILSIPIRIIYKILRVPARILFKVFRKFFRKAKTVGKHRISKAMMFKRIFKNIRKKI